MIGVTDICVIQEGFIGVTDICVIQEGFVIGVTDICVIQEGFVFVIGRKFFFEVSRCLLIQNVVNL